MALVKPRLDAQTERHLQAWCMRNVRHPEYAKQDVVAFLGQCDAGDHAYWLKLGWAAVHAEATKCRR